MWSRAMKESVRALLIVMVYALLRSTSSLAPSVEIGDRFKTWLINGKILSIHDHNRWLFVHGV